MASALAAALVAASVALLTASLASRAWGGVLLADARCDGGAIVVTWTFHDDPARPAGHPEWVAYDVLRRSLAACGELVGVNPEPVPRLPGTHTQSWIETPPEQGVTYAYRVIPVDAGRQRVLLGTDCEPPCTGLAWPSCPDLSAPVVVGTLEDHGWALFVRPCPQGCWDPFYVEGPVVEELRPHAATGTPIGLYGRARCGSVEGCALAVERWGVSACGPTPAQRRSWGRVKTLYRD